MPQLLNENEVSYYLGKKHIYPKVEGGGGGSAEIPIVNHGTSDTTYTLPANEFHIWGEVASLILTLALPDDDTIVNEYMFQFTSGSTATTLSLPSNISWIGGSAVVEANTVYQVSIINNIAVIGGA